jgi:hypothetical protein
MEAMPAATPPNPAPKRNDVAEAYRSIGVSPDLVSSQPMIRHELARIGRAIRRASNVPASPYYYLSLSDAPDARAVLAAYYAVSPRQRKYLPIEAFCVKAGVTTTQCYDAVLVSMQRSNRLVSAAVASATHPQIVIDTIGIALDPHVAPETRLTAQQLLHRAVGFTPLPRHAQTIVNVSAIAESQSAAAQLSSGGAPPPERTIRRLSERLNALRPGVPAALPAAEIPESATPLVEVEDARSIARRSQVSPILSIDAPFAPRYETLRRARVRDGQIVMEEERVYLDGTIADGSVTESAALDEDPDDDEA